MCRESEAKILILTGKSQMIGYKTIISFLAGLSSVLIMFIQKDLIFPALQQLLTWPKYWLMRAILRVVFSQKSNNQRLGYSVWLPPSQAFRSTTHARMVLDNILSCSIFPDIYLNWLFLFIPANVPMFSSPVIALVNLRSAPQASIISLPAGETPDSPPEKRWTFGHSFYCFHSFGKIAGAEVSGGRILRIASSSAGVP